MNIEEMNTQEKTKILCELAGFRLICIDGFCDALFIPTESGEEKPYNCHGWAIDLYDSNHMALAWRVAHWANSQRYKVPAYPGEPNNISNFWGWELIDWCDFSKGAEIAQAEWLDAILSLAIAEGRVEA